MHTSAQGAPAASRKPGTRSRALEPIRVDGPLPFPDLPSPTERTDRGRFWLAAWMADQRRVEAFRAHMNEAAVWKKLDPNEALASAFVTASGLLQHEARESAKMVRDHGYLPCAWAGTTALEQPQ